MTNLAEPESGPSVELPERGPVRYRAARHVATLSLFKTLLPDLAPPHVSGVSSPADKAHVGEIYRSDKGWVKETADEKGASAPEEKRAAAIEAYCSAANELLSAPALAHRAISRSTYRYGKPAPASRVARPRGTNQALRLWRHREKLWIETELKRLRADAPLLSEPPENTLKGFALFERLIGVISGLERPFPMLWCLAPDSTELDLRLKLFVPSSSKHLRLSLKPTGNRFVIDKEQGEPSEAHQWEVILSQSLAAAIAASLFQHDLRQVSVGVAQTSKLSEAIQPQAKATPLGELTLGPSIWRSPPSAHVSPDIVSAYEGCDIFTDMRSDAMDTA